MADSQLTCLVQTSYATLVWSPHQPGQPSVSLYYSSKVNRSTHQFSFVATYWLTFCLVATSCQLHCRTLKFDFTWQMKYLLPLSLWKIMCLVWPFVLHESTMSVLPHLSTSTTIVCEDSIGTVEESIMVNLANIGISRASQDLVPPVHTPTVPINGGLGQPGHPTKERSLTTDYQTVTHTTCSPKLHISPPKSILHQSKYSRQDWIKNPYKIGLNNY